MMKPIWISLLAVGMTTSAFGQAEPLRQYGAGGGVITVAPDGRSTQTLLVDGLYAAGEAAPLSHWIGLGCTPATEALRSQLGLKDVGIVVFDVAPDSPAKAAGFETNDVLTKATIGEKEIPLKDTSDLIRSVREADSKPLIVQALRAGKTISLQVTPAQRPQPPVSQQQPLGISMRQPGVIVDPQRINEFIEKKDLDGLKKYLDQQEQAGPMGYRLHFAGPVVAVPPGAAPALPLGDRAQPVQPQENLTISITRHGNEPAKITVKRGADEWGASEYELNTLPEDIRRQVEGMLQGLTAHSLRDQVRRGFVGGPKMAPVAPVPATPAPPPNFYPLPRSHAPADTDRKLQQQQKQLDQVLQELHDLKQALDKLQPKN